MREILFRGKRTDNGEWAYGAPVYIDGYVEMYWFDSEKQEIEHTLVAPETVGQYTGLKDKNGKKIFEGDVVKRTVYIGSGHSHAYEDYIHVVRYKFGAFDPRTFIMNESCEIIGNIRDNPELLEVE